MGSRANRARKGIVAPPRAIKSTTSDKPPSNAAAFRSIPDLARVDVVFGDIRHLPPMKDIPDRFRQHRDPYVEFVSLWFFGGRTEDDMKRLTERPGVERGKALAAIAAILRSFEPKHEHKEAGAAFLLHEWFELT